VPPGYPQQRHVVRRGVRRSRSERIEISTTPRMYHP
jgi:hypothetical protein